MSLIDPLTRRRLERFRASRGAWWSLLALSALCVMAAMGPLLVGNRALVVSTERGLRFPAVAGFIASEEFGLPGKREPDYRLLGERLQAEKRGWALMPPVPFSPEQVCEGMSYMLLPCGGNTLIEAVSYWEAAAKEGLVPGPY